MIINNFLNSNNDSLTCKGASVFIKLPLNRFPINPRKNDRHLIFKKPVEQLQDILWLIYQAQWGAPHLLPRYLQLELSRPVLRNIARFCLCGPLRVETGCWQIHNRLCDICDLCMSRTKSKFFNALAKKFAIREGDSKNNLLISYLHWRHRRFLL